MNSLRSSAVQQVGIGKRANRLRGELDALRRSGTALTPLRAPPLRGGCGTPGVVWPSASASAVGIKCSSLPSASCCQRFSWRQRRSHSSGGELARCRRWRRMLPATIVTAASHQAGSTPGRSWPPFALLRIWAHRGRRDRPSFRGWPCAEALERFRPLAAHQKRSTFPCRSIGAEAGVAALSSSKRW